jgi:hypothetical protein
MNKLSFIKAKVAIEEIYFSKTDVERFFNVLDVKAFLPNLDLRQVLEGFSNLFSPDFKKEKSYFSAGFLLDFILFMIIKHSIKIRQYMNNFLIN